MRFLNILKQPKIIDMDFVESRKAKIINLCRQNGLDFFYVHGSLAKDQLKPLSDIDVALQKKTGALDLDEQLRLIGELQTIFEREDIDLVDLAAAPPPLKMRILKTGKLLFAANQNALTDFRYQAARRFLDTVYLRKSFSKYLRLAVGVA